MGVRIVPFAMVGSAFPACVAGYENDMAMSAPESMPTIGSSVTCRGNCFLMGVRL